MQPTVSIIIRAYNAERYLREALFSIVSQTYDDKKEVLILFDKGSKTEKALEIASEFKKKYDNDLTVFEIIKHEHMTPFRALQLGLKYAKGNYIGFLDYDNIYKDDFLERNVKELENGVDATFTFSTPVNERLEPIDISENLPTSLKILKFFISKPPLKWFVDHPPSKLDLTKLLIVNYVDISSLMISSTSKDILIKAFEKLNHRYFDWIYEDWLSALILAKENVKSKRVDGTTYFYRIHEQNITATLDPEKELPKTLMHLEREVKTLKAFQFLYKDKLSLRERAILKGILIRKLFKIL